MDQIGCFGRIPYNPWTKFRTRIWTDIMTQNNNEMKMPPGFKVFYLDSKIAIIKMLLFNCTFFFFI